MSRAKALIERMCPMPVVEPKPGTAPSTPSRPSVPPKRREHPNPFRRGKVKPGEEPKPKAHESVAKLPRPGGANLKALTPEQRAVYASGIVRESRGESLARTLIEDSDFVEKMRAAREAKKNGGKAPEGKEDEKDESGGEKKGDKKTPPKKGSKAKDAVEHAFK